MKLYKTLESELLKSDDFAENGRLKILKSRIGEDDRVNGKGAL